MSFQDYVVKYSDDPHILAHRILYSVHVRPVKGDKPSISMLIGGSGEGKSYGIVRVEEVLLEAQGLKLTPELVEAINIFTPLEYVQKIKRLLKDPALKKVNIVVLHEASNIVSAALWQKFLTRAVASIHNQSRKIKPLIVFVVSQHLSGIARSTRITCQYYIEAKRSLGHAPKFTYFKIWERKQGLEKSELMPRRLCGYVIDKEGRWRRHYMQHFEMGMPAKENIEVFDRLDLNSKEAILEEMLSESLKKVKEELGDFGKKIDSMVDHYSKDLAKLQLIGKQYRGKWKLNKEIMEMHDLTDNEARIFEERLTKRLQEKKILEVEAAIEREEDDFKIMKDVTEGAI